MLTYPTGTVTLSDAVRALRSATGVVELAPWLSEGSTRIVVVHGHAGCEDSSMR